MHRMSRLYVHVTCFKNGHVLGRPVVFLPSFVLSCFLVLLHFVVCFCLYVDYKDARLSGGLLTYLLSWRHVRVSAAGSCCVARI